MRIHNRLLILILAISMMLASLSLTSGHSWGDDFAAYILQACSLVDGRIVDNIESNRFTIESSTYILGPVLYPWGYPILIAPIYAAFGLSLIAYKILNIFIYLLFLICVYFIFEDRLDPIARLVMLGVLGFSPTMLAFQDHILSDLPYLFFCTLSVLWMDRWSKLANDSNRAKNSANIWRALGLGAVCFVACYIRTSGIILLFTLLAAQILNRTCFGMAYRRRGNAFPDAGWAFIQWIPYLVFGLLLALSSGLLPRSGDEYIGQALNARGWVQLKNIGLYALLPSTIWHSWTENSLPNLLIGLPLLTVAATGILKNWRKDWLFLIYGFFSLILLFAYPIYQGFRFILPLLPFYLYFLFKGFSKLGQDLSERLGKGWLTIPHSLYGMILLILFVQATIQTAHNLANGREKPGPFDPISQQMFETIAQKAKPDDVVVFFKPRLMRLLTGREILRGAELRSSCQGQPACFTH